MGESADTPTSRFEQAMSGLVAGHVEQDRELQRRRYRRDVLHVPEEEPHPDDLTFEDE